MAANRGPDTCARSAASTPSTCGASSVSSLGITRQDHIPYSDILECARIRSMYSLLSQRHLRWLGHVRRMEDGCLPKDILYGQLTSGARPVGCPALRFKDACKRDMKACDISPKGWEAVAEDRTAWRQATHRGIERADEKKHQHDSEKRMRRLPKFDKLTTGCISIISSRLRSAYYPAISTANHTAMFLRGFPAKQSTLYIIPVLCTHWMCPLSLQQGD